MNWKRILTAGILTGALTIGSAEALTVKVDGRDLTAGSYLEGGTTYVPLRVLSQSLGEVDARWDGTTAWVEGRGLTLTARPGDTWIEANAQKFDAPGGVRLENGTTLVPVRALAAAMGAEVTWDGAAQTVELTSRRAAEADRPGGAAGGPSAGGAPTQPGDTAGGPSAGQAPAQPSYTQEDLYWLSRIISAESQGEPLEGKLAVGTVVLNRVASPEFPDTIYGVIFDRKWGVQFTPVANGTIYLEPTQESVEAARMVLEGARAAGNSLYFQNPDLTADRWAANNRKFVATIGCHWFYE